MFDDNDVFNGVSTHSRLKAAGPDYPDEIVDGEVSTHSRLKAAGKIAINSLYGALGFNTQPPKGGW